MLDQTKDVGEPSRTLAKGLAVENEGSKPRIHLKFVNGNDVIVSYPGKKQVGGEDVFYGVPLTLAVNIDVGTVIELPGEKYVKVVGQGLNATNVEETEKPDKDVPVMPFYQMPLDSVSSKQRNEILGIPDENI